MRYNNKIKAYVTENKLKYHVITYGCQMNDHESEKLKGILEGTGYLPVDSVAEADLIVFNTCCVRENAEQKVFGNVGALKKQKSENPGLIIAVCGCMTQQADTAKRLAQTFPFVDIVLGTHNQYEIADKLCECLFSGTRVFDVRNEGGVIPNDVPVKREGGPLASVNIMYGCNNFCSYCIVPYVRGRERSRTPQAVIDEMHSLTANGYKEVMLLGQNVNSYHGSDTDFPQLLQMLCHQTDISRIRFMTSHPKDLSDGLIDAIKNNKQVCKQIHLPVQSGSTHILSAMNRDYTREHYMDLIRKLRAAVPEIVITTDFIVGFPGETERDFTDTLTLAEQVRFDSAFTFVYSKRSGTKAAEMENIVDADTQRERILHLINLQNSITEEKNRAYEGKVERILIEGVSTRGRNHVCGRTDGGKMVNFPGGKELIGKFGDVKITQAKRTTLLGEMIEG